MDPGGYGDFFAWNRAGHRPDDSRHLLRYSRDDRYLFGGQCIGVKYLAVAADGELSFDSGLSSP